MVHTPDEDQPLKTDTERIARISTSISLKHRCVVSSQNHKPCAVILLLFINEGWAAAGGDRRKQPWNADNVSVIVEASKGIQCV